MAVSEQAWIQGTTELAACCNDRDLTPAMLSAKGDAYRRHLDYLSDDRWLSVVSQAIQTHTWFPSLAELMHIAAEQELRHTGDKPLALAWPKQEPGEVPAVRQRQIEAAAADVEAWGKEMRAVGEENKRRVKAGSPRLPMPNPPAMPPPVRNLAEFAAYCKALDVPPPGGERGQWPLETAAAGEERG